MIKNKKLIILFSFVLIAVLMACSMGGDKTTQEPTREEATAEMPTEESSAEAPTEESTSPLKPTKSSGLIFPTKVGSSQGGSGSSGGSGGSSGKLEVINPTFYVDTYDATHIIGMVQNNSSQMVSYIELNLEARNADGKTLLKDGNDAAMESTTIYPMLTNLFPGESSPFESILYLENETVASVNVTVASSYEGDETRLNVSVENTQLLNLGDGDYYLTGEVVNQSDEPVVMHNMAGALMDANNQAAAVNHAYYYSHSLAAAGNKDGMDRSPFIIGFNGPADSNLTEFQVFLDPIQPFEDYPIEMNVSLSHFYFDEYGSLHLVGVVENKGLTVQSGTLVAGVYDANGIVLDAGTDYVGFYLEPNTSIPFDANSFSIIYWNDELVNRADNYTVQVDPYYSDEPYGQVVPLETFTITENLNGSYWEFSGELTNDSGKELGWGVAVVAVYSGDTLVGASNAFFYPSSGSIPVGGTEPFNVYLSLDPNLDFNSLTYKVFVQGITE